jgi:hypothetical protein
MLIEGLRSISLLHRANVLAELNDPLLPLC